MLVYIDTENVPINRKNLKETEMLAIDSHQTRKYFN